MKGFTLFFAMLVASLALAVGLAIYDLTIRELDLSGTETQSQYAIYAADTGAECALFWDLNYPTTHAGSAFATSSASAPPSSGITCYNADIAAAGTPPSGGFSVPQTTGNNWTHWSIASAASSATTTFWLYLGVPGGNVATSSCAMVTVAKNGSPTATTITAHGYNTCAGGALQLERALQVNY